MRLQSFRRRRNMDHVSGYVGDRHLTRSPGSISALAATAAATRASSQRQFLPIVVCVDLEGIELGEVFQH
jgi:hypothetical protein